MQTLSERISLALEKSGLSQSDLASACNIKPPSVNDWISGKTKTLKSSTAHRAAAALGVSFIWLTEGRGTMDRTAEASRHAGSEKEIDPSNDYSPIRRVRFKLSAGVSGFAVDFEDGESSPIFFRKDWFTKGGYNPENLFAVRISGDSMTPSLYDGDLVIINTADTMPRDGEAFAANYEGELVIKRVRLERGDCWLDSDHSDQVRFRPRQCGEGCFIIGRVIYKQSERI